MPGSLHNVYYFPQNGRRLEIMRMKRIPNGCAFFEAGVETPVAQALNRLVGTKEYNYVNSY